MRRNGTHENTAVFGVPGTLPRKEGVEGYRKKDEENEREQRDEEGFGHGRKRLFVLEKRLRGEGFPTLRVEGGLVDDGGDGEDDAVVLRPPRFRRARERDILSIVVGKYDALVVVKDGNQDLHVLFVVVFGGEDRLVVKERGAFGGNRRLGGFERMGHGKEGLFVLKNAEGGLEVDGFVRGFPDDPVRKVGSVLAEEMAEKLLLAFEKGVVFGVGEKEVEVGFGLLFDEGVDEDVLFLGNAYAVEGGRTLEDRLEVEIETGAEVVGGHLLGGHPERDYRRIVHFAEGAGFLPELDSGDGERRVLVLGVRAEGFAVGPGNVHLDFVLVLVEDVQAFVVDDEGMARRTLDFPVGLFSSDPDDLGAGGFVDDPGKEIVGGNPGEVYAVVEAGDDAGFGGVDSEVGTELREILGVRGPEETDEFDVVVEGLGGRLQLRFEVYGGHHVPERVENVEDFQFRAGDEPEPTDTEVAEVHGEVVGVGNDSEEGGDRRAGTGKFDREEVAVFVKDVDSLLFEEFGGFANPRGRPLVFHFSGVVFRGNKAGKKRNLGEASFFGLP